MNFDFTKILRILDTAKQKIFSSNALIHGLYCLLGTVLVGVFGTLTFFDSAYATDNRKSSQTSQTSAQVQNVAENVSAQDNNSDKSNFSQTRFDLEEEQSFEFIQFKKAEIGDYDMTAVSLDELTEEITDPDSFKVQKPEDTGKYYNIKPDAIKLTDTRSVAEEYYTVYDIISGSDVTLNGHELICRMVNSEIGDSWGEEAIKAQAVAAYSYIRFNDSIGLKPTVGLKAGYSSKLERCVNAVEGQTVMYKGDIINAVYSASTSGYSTTSKDIWGTSYPYLQRVKSEYDNEDPNWGLKTSYSKQQVKDIVYDETGIELGDDVTKWFTIDECFCGKYVKSASIGGKSGFSGVDLCNIFSVKSKSIEISFKDGVFTFTTYGWGHGVGMSQWGACLYARHGWTYDQILRHYYVGTSIAVSKVNTKAVDRGLQGEITEDESNEDSSADTEEVTDSQLPEDTDSSENDGDTESSESGEDSSAEDSSLEIPEDSGEESSEEQTEESSATDDDNSVQEETAEQPDTDSTEE